MPRKEPGRRLDLFLSNTPPILPFQPVRRLLPIALLLSASASAADGVAFFESKVRPLLVKHCYECHSQEGKVKGGLLLDRKEGWQKGGDAGPALVPGQPAKSLLLHSVRYEDEDLQMPPKSKLPPEDIATLEQWIQMGAPDPRTEGLATAKPAKSIDIESARQGWAYRPLQKAAIPAVKDKAWPRNDIDAFILAEIEAKGLQPAADADLRTLKRRLSYDLTGLPPDQSGLSDVTDYVERLLQSPAFGEKWGRHWLDLARYADSNGGDRNYTFFQAWRYRNYVIDAFNRDKSYYDFIREQIAGDLMPSKNDAQRRERMIAPTFLALGPKMLTERDKEKLHLDTVDEQLDTIGKSMLGLSLGCARCHDHKFDPVSQRGYYALAGFMRSTEIVMGTRNGCVNVASWVEQALPQPGPAYAELKTRIARLELAMRLKVERDFMETVGGKKTLNKLPLAGVIYDESAAELIGDWKQSNLSKNRFGDFYIRNDKQGQGIKKAVFRGALPETGVYEVRLAYPAKGNCDKRVPIAVEAFDGVHEIIFDQTKKPSIGGLFEPIGRFHFEKGGRVNVIIGTQGTKDHVIVDAVQFISEKDIERESMALAMANGSTTGDPLLMMDSASLTKELTKQIDALKDAELAMTPRDFADSGDVNLRVRGEVTQLGPKVPRNFLSVLHKGPAPKIPAGSSGRLQLANWLTSKDNALLDRVIVNRLWAQLFGRGIVSTVDNFGVQGEKPTHPALLDHLAAKFRASGGSIKALIREMVLSRTYQLAAEGKSQRVSADPENKLFARHSYRRLTAEEIRDSLLQLTGELKSEQAKATALTYGEDLDDLMKLDGFTHRSVYLPIARNNLAPDLEIFDAANPEMTAGDRPLTTVPTQALYLLNSPFLQKQGATLAQQAYAQADPVTWLHEAILGRGPSATAAKRANDFINTANDDREKALADLAHVLLASTEFLFLE
jgi:cytochrome c553